MKAVSKKVLCSILVAVGCIFIALIPRICDPRVPELLQELSCQQGEWDKIESRHLLIAKSCGHLAAPDITIQQLRLVFGRYQNETTAFLDIITRRTSEALRAESCSDFVRTSRLAISQSTSIAASLSALLRSLPEGLISNSQRHKIARESASTTFLFTSQTQQLLRSLHARLWRMVLPIWSLHTFRKEPGRVHNESGVAMLASRSCAYHTKAMDMQLKFIKQSFEKSLTSHSYFVAASVAYSKAWDSSEVQKDFSCTTEYLNAMGHYHHDVVNVGLLGH